MVTETGALSTSALRLTLPYSAAKQKINLPFRLIITLTCPSLPLNQQATIDDRLRQWYGSRNHQTDRLDLAVLDNATVLCVGEVVLSQWDEANDSCNLRILLGPTGRNRGLGTEATRLMLGHAFTVLGLHRVSLEVYAVNPRAQHVYEKAGFTVEGIKRDALRFDGQRVNAVMMSILAHEWTAPYMP